MHFFAAHPWTTSTWNDQILSFFEEDNGKAINSTISVRTRVWPPLFIFNMNSLLLSNWATCDNCEMIWKDAESIFQRGFHGHPRHCRIVRSLLYFWKGLYSPWHVWLLHSLVSFIDPSHPSFTFIQVRFRLWVPVWLSEEQVVEHSLHFPHNENPAAEIQFICYLIKLLTILSSF